MLSSSPPWTEQGVILASGTPTGVAFDAAVEQLWIGCNDGTLASYHFPDLQVGLGRAILVSWDRILPRTRLHLL